MAIVRRAFHPRDSSCVGLSPVAVVLAIGQVCVAVVADQSGQGESVVAGDEG